MTQIFDGCELSTVTKMTLDILTREICAGEDFVVLRETLAIYAEVVSGSEA